MDKCNDVDSTHKGNGRPGAGIVFQAVDKLLSAVSALIDNIDETGASGRALALVTRRENQLIDASAKCDARLESLRLQLAAANAKLQEAARLAQDTRDRVKVLTGDITAAVATHDEAFDRAREACEILQRPNFVITASDGMSHWYSHDEAWANLRAYFATGEKEG